MNLTSLVPRESRFKLNQVKDRDFTMRPINLADELWMEEEFGERLGKIFEEINIKEISRIVFRLLVDDDKKFFKKREVKIVNEEGDEDKIELGGVNLLRALISGISDKTGLLESLLENIGLSRPQIKEMGEAGLVLEEEEEKKSLQK